MARDAYPMRSYALRAVGETGSSGSGSSSQPGGSSRRWQSRHLMEPMVPSADATTKISFVSPQTGHISLRSSSLMPVDALPIFAAVQGVLANFNEGALPAQRAEVVLFSAGRRGSEKKSLGWEFNERENGLPWFLIAG